MNIHVFYTGIIETVNKKKLNKSKRNMHVHVVSILIKDQLLYQILQLIKRLETPEMNEY